MTRLVLSSYLLLLKMEWHMCFRDLRSIHHLLRRIEGGTQSSRIPAEMVCRAMALACVFYPKKVLCLQRSSATTLLLRRHSYPAEMVIGAQVFPFRSHAWVEIESVIVNDKPYLYEMYRVLERC